MWSIKERKDTIEALFNNTPTVTVVSYKGLTAKFCKKINAQYIIRGLRNSTDFTYEQNIAQANNEVNGVDSVFLIARPKYSYISSSIVRDIARNGGDISTLIP